MLFAVQLEPALDRQELDLARRPKQCERMILVDSKSSDPASQPGIGLIVRFLRRVYRTVGAVVVAGIIVQLYVWTSYSLRPIDVSGHSSAER